MIKLETGTELLRCDIGKFKIDDEYPFLTQLFSEYELYKNSSIKPGANNFINALKEKYGVDSLQIVTASHSKLDTNKKDELIYELTGIQDIVHSGDKKKSLFTNKTILVDDNFHNLMTHIEDNNSNAILCDFGYGWNQMHKTNKHPLLHVEDSYTNILDKISKIID